MESATLDIDVSDVISEKQDVAQKELLTCFAPIVDNFGVYIKILITRNFDSTINYLLRKNSGFDYQYSSKREQGIAATGRMFSEPKEDTVSFTLIFNGHHLSDWQDHILLWRRVIFLHEAIHIIDETLRFKEIGNACFSEPHKANEIMNNLSFRIWTEYNAVRGSAEAIAGIPNIITSDVEKYTLHQGYVDSFAGLIKTLPDLLVKNVTAFRKRIMGIDQLARNVFPILSQSLILATYVAAQYDALEKKNRLEELVDGDYSFFFDRWTIVHNKIQSIYDSFEKINEKRIIEMANDIRLLYLNCGFTMTDTENGLYVAVSFPNLHNKNPETLFPF
ncbi:MAG: hypothetical protein NWF00_06585 [Candidatus Bathyarchaeota archaeon]|nr:hypothetical protein [Candidatus Bathyarchaeota archaeon]